MKIHAGSWEPTSPIATAEIVTKENSTSVLRSLGFGTVGLIALGPLGLLAGAIGGASKQRTLIAIGYQNGNAALVECKRNEVNAILAAAFTRTSVQKPVQKSAVK